MSKIQQAFWFLKSTAVLFTLSDNISLMTTREIVYVFVGIIAYQLSHLRSTRELNYTTKQKLFVESQQAFW